MDILGSFPMHGEVEWIPTEAGGRKRPHPGPTYATVGWRECIGPEKGLASFVLQGFAPTWERSQADGRWLFNQTDPVFVISPPEVVVVAEGLRPVARFYVDLVDSPEQAWARIEAWLRDALRGVPVAESAHAMAVEYLDHNELGLAFEEIVEALAKQGEPVGPRERRLLGNAAVDMNLTDNSSWKRLRRARDD